MITYQDLVGIYIYIVVLGLVMVFLLDMYITGLFVIVMAGTAILVMVEGIFIVKKRDEEYDYCNDMV